MAREAWDDHPITRSEWFNMDPQPPWVNIRYIVDALSPYAAFGAWVQTCAYLHPRYRTVAHAGPDQPFPAEFVRACAQAGVLNPDGTITVPAELWAAALWRSWELFLRNNARRSGKGEKHMRAARGLLLLFWANNAPELTSRAFRSVAEVRAHPQFPKQIRMSDRVLRATLKEFSHGGIRFTGGRTPKVKR